MDWTDMAKCNDEWWAIDKKFLTNSGFERMRETSGLAEKLAACQEWLSHGAGQSESELYKTVAISCNICKQKVFLMSHSRQTWLEAVSIQNINIGIIKPVLVPVIPSQVTNRRLGTLGWWEGV